MLPNIASTRYTSFNTEQVIVYVSIAPSSKHLYNEGRNLFKW